MTEDPQIMLERMYSEQQMTEQSLTMLQQRIEMVQVYMTNYRSGLLVLEEIENRKDGEEMLMHLHSSTNHQSRQSNSWDWGWNSHRTECRRCKNSNC